MRLTVTTDDNAYFMEVSEDMELQDLQALVEAESSVAMARQVLVHNGKPLSGAHTSLKTLGLQNDDVVVLALARPAPAQPQGGGRPQPQAGGRQAQPNNPNDPYVIREMIRSDPALLARLRFSDSALADAAMEDNPARFLSLIQERDRERLEREQQELALLTADPFDIDAQRKIEERIQQQNITANLETAMEYNPEAFGTVVMLYIDVLVNRVPVKAFVDSGAQMTIMSDTCAERCGIMRLVDKRFAGIARGVGHAKILGRVHSADVKIADHFLPCSFSVMEKQPMDMLIGLDFLKRFQCCIDLKKNVLVIGTTATETPFLLEKDLPLSARPGGSDLTDEERSTLLGEKAPAATPMDTSTPSAAPRNDRAGTATATTSTLTSSTNTRPSPMTTTSSTATTTTVSPPVTATAPRNAPQASPARPSEADIATLVGLGFSRPQVLEALHATNNNLDLAASYLFSMTEY